MVRTKEEILEYQKQWRKNNKNKINAWKKKNSSKIKEYQKKYNSKYYEDYNKPLEVIALCCKCHNTLHKRRK